MSEIKTPLRGMMAPIFSLSDPESDFLWEDDVETSVEEPEPPLPHRNHEKRCPPLPEEGVRATAAEPSTLSDIEAAERAEAEAQAAHFARWRQAIVDAEVLRRPAWLD